jgi:hypothetical protein
MPCDSSYMEPNQKERNSKEICEHLVYMVSQVVPNQYWIPLEDWIKRGAKEYYGVPDRIDDLTRILCNWCKLLETDGRWNDIIYDGRNPKARRLADWWDEHKEADKERLGNESLR